MNFEELHNLVTNQNYYIEKIEIVKKLFQKNKFSKEECYDLLTSITFFEKEFYKLDSRTMSILKSEITRITNCFISDYQVSKTFNPTQIEQNFYGLEEILSKGKIVVLNMNIAEYKNLSKIVCHFIQYFNTTRYVTDEDLIFAYLVAQEWMKIVYPEFL